MQHESTHLNNPLMQHVLLATIGAVAASFIAILPLVVGSMIDHLGYSAELAGGVAAANMVGIAVGTFMASYLLKRIPLMAVFASSIVLLAMAEGLSAMVEGVLLLSSSRAGSGIGAGLISGCVVYAIAQLAKPKQGYAMYMVGMFLISVVGLFLLPPFITEWGIRGLFLLLAAISAASILLLPLLRLPVDHDVRARSDKTARSRIDTLSWLCLLSILFFQVGNGGLWAFIERVGLASGFSAELIGQVLAFSSFCGIGGALVSGPLQSRVHSTWLMAIGFAVSMISALALTASDSLAIFIFGICAMSISWAFTVPIVQTLLAENERGDVAVLAMFMYWCGLAIGPYILGFIISMTVGYQMALWCCGLFYGLSLACVLPIGKKVAVLRRQQASTM